MKTESQIRELLKLRKHDFEINQKMIKEHPELTGINDVTERSIRDILWILDDPEFNEW